MVRILCLLFLTFLVNVELSGQCTNTPVITLSSTEGNSCGTAAFTLAGNTFGGSATKITITENGAGSVSPSSSTKSPFSFTYTPKSSDIGKIITITVVTDNPSGPCIAVRTTFTLSISAIPKEPVVGIITKPTCSVATGSVSLSGLPTESWTLTRSPGNITTPGSGTSVTLTGLPSGTYNYTVTTSAGCVSPSSPNVVIPAQTGSLAAVTIGLITQPTCNLSTGSVVLNGLPSAGTWTLTRSPGSVITTGTGVSVTITNLPAGTYTYTVTNSSGCTSPSSANIVLRAVTLAPAAPVIGTITQPSSGIPIGSVVLNNLPGNGAWTLKQTPGNIIIPGSGNTVTISGLQPGIYYFSVTNAELCTSGLSESVTIATEKALLVVTSPTPVCFPATVDLTDQKITAGSTPGLIFTYWTDASATIQYTTPKTATAGKWFIKGSLPDGTSDIESVMVTVYHPPLANAGSDQGVISQTSANLDAGILNDSETGLWSIISGRGEIFDPSYPKTTVDSLAEDKNILVWKVTNGVCTPSYDTIVITVRTNVIPSLITPNMDGKNDYLVIKGFNSPEKIELIVFDRRGALVFKSDNYDNKWNGIDMFGKPLEGDTYFYTLRTPKNTTLRGFLVIKR